MTKQELLRQTETIDQFIECFQKLIRSDVGFSLHTIHEIEEKVARKKKELKEAVITATDEDEGLLVASFIAPLIQSGIKPPHLHVLNHKSGKGI